MVAQESLTNEQLLKKFKSQFELVTHAIKLAENMIRTGREPRVKTEMQNRSLQAVLEINCGKDLIEEPIVEIKETHIVDQNIPVQPKFMDALGGKKLSDKKKRIRNVSFKD